MSDQHTHISEDFQMINQSEFARRLKVCVGTVRNWRKTGVLLPERDYLLKGRIIRFPWSMSVMTRLMSKLAHDAPPRPRLKSRRQNRRTLKLKA